MSKISYFRFFPLFGGTIGQDIIRNCSCILRQIFFRIPIKIRDADKVSVQGVVALGGHFATLCLEVDFYEANFFSLLIFKKKRQIL